MLAALGIAIGSTLEPAGRRRLHGYNVAGRFVAANFQHWQLTLYYFVADDPTRTDVNHSWRWFGFKRGRMYSGPTKTYSQTLYAAYCPSMVVIGCLAAYPTLAFIRGPMRRRNRRRRHGLCLKCGYDLTGNTSGVCPECGTAIDPLGK